MCELPFLPELVLLLRDVRPVRAEDPLRVHENHVPRLRSRPDQDLRGPDVRGPGPDEGDRDVRKFLPHDLQGVEHARHVDRRGPLLVVVPYRDVHLLPEPLEDPEALRLRDVLEVHPAEGGREPLHELDNLVRVLCRDGDRVRIDTAEILEQERLPLHHRETRLGPDVPEAEDPRAIGDDRDVVPLVRELPHFRGVRLDVEARLCDPGRVPDREVLVAPDRDLRDNLDLPLVERVVLRGELLREVRSPQLLRIRDLRVAGGSGPLRFRADAAAGSHRNHQDPR